MKNSARAVDEKSQGTILIVEDEPLLLKMNEVFLARNGFSVLSARCGKEALQVAAAHPHPIDLLLTDLHIPEVDGESLAGMMCETYQGLRVVILTGSCDDKVASRLLTSYEVLFKPFGMDELVQTVRRVLT